MEEKEERRREKEKRKREKEKRKKEESEYLTRCGERVRLGEGESE